MSRRILSVGYDQVSLTLRNWVLERAGYTVLPANSKLEALQLLEQEPCDLVVIAGSLSKLDISEIVSAAAGRAPILWLGGGAREELAGISAYMALLDGPDVLLDNVGQLLGQAKPAQTARLRPILKKQQQNSKRRA
jgi:CheY-like chemotaxis protein